MVDNISSHRRCWMENHVKKTARSVWIHFWVKEKNARKYGSWNVEIVSTSNALPNGRKIVVGVLIVDTNVLLNNLSKHISIVL
tara:strand:- start:214 stop:462 length:249 start_codon:yes stop_codon:yes gene_type:complete